MNEFFTTIRRFLTEYLPDQRCCRPNTIRSYRQGLNLFVTYLRTTLGIPVTSIDFPIIDRAVVVGFLGWLEHDRGCQAATRNQRLMALQALLAQPDTTTTAGRRNQVLMIIMYDTAARCSEITGLRIRDLNLNTDRPTVHLHGKGDKTRIVPLLPRTAEHCRQHLRRCHRDDAADSDAFVFFTTIHGRRQPISADTVAAFMKTYGNTAREDCPGMPKRVHPHMLRHTRAMHLYRQGLPLPLLADFLGHASIESTRIYAYADTEMKRSALAKANPHGSQATSVKPLWEGDDDMILTLAGLTLPTQLSRTTSTPTASHQAPQRPPRNNRTLSIVLIIPSSG